MKEILKTLDSHISIQRPDFYKNLRKPLDEKDIQRIENQYKIHIPDDLKALYLWKNGQESSCYEAFLNNSTFIALDDALEIAAELTAMIGNDFEIKNWWNEHWIPVFHNGGGSYICYDCIGIFTGNKGQIIEFWKGDHDRNVIAGSLEVLLKSLNDYYTSSHNNGFDEFLTIENNENGFPKRFIVK